MNNEDENKTKQPWYEKLGRAYVEIAFGRWNPFVRLGKLGGRMFSGEKKILFLLGDTLSGKTEVMNALSDSQYAPYFWGIQHHADGKTPGEVEDVIQLGCTPIIINDGAGVESAKRARMSQVETSLIRFLKCQTKKTFEAKGYVIPVYVAFAFDVSADNWDMEGVAAELRI